MEHTRKAETQCMSCVVCLFSESVDCEYPFMSSPSEVERETPPASVQSSENETVNDTFPIQN